MIEGKLPSIAEKTMENFLEEITVRFFFFSTCFVFPSILNLWHLVHTELNVYFNKFVTIDRNCFKLTSPYLFKQK